MSYFRNKAKSIIDDYLTASNKNSTEKYKCIVANAANNHECAYTSYDLCKDNYIGNVSSKSSDLWALIGLRYNNKASIYKIPYENSNNGIVVVMESPHREEFKPQLIAPALGKTGEKIHKYLWKILNDNSLLDDTKSPVYLVNAVRYQCSLGFDTSLYRDINFKGMFTEKDLIKRIKLCEPKIIIVACTFSTKAYVIECIKKEFDNTKFDVFQASEHPSCWGNNTSLIKVQCENHVY